MNEIIKQFKEWKQKHPEEDYQYDEIHEFFADLTRGDMLSFMEWAEKLSDERSNCNIPYVSERTWTVDEIIENLRPFQSANNAAQWFNMYGR